jgi:hypothetical protein
MVVGRPRRWAGLQAEVQDARGALELPGKPLRLGDLTPKSLRERQVVAQDQPTSIRSRRRLCDVEEVDELPLGERHARHVAAQLSGTSTATSNFE